MKVPAWRFRARRGPKSMYDGLRLRELVIRCPTSAAPGGYVVLDRLLKGVVVDEPVVIVLEAAHVDQERLSEVLAGSVRDLLVAEDYMTAAAQLEYAAPGAPPPVEPTPAVPDDGPPGA